MRVELFVGRLRKEVDARPHVLVVGHNRTNRLLVGVLHGLALEETAAAGPYHPDPGALVDLRVAVKDASLRLVPTSTLDGRQLDAPG